MVINLILFQILQMIIFALLGLTIFVKLWNHSYSTFLIVVITSLTTLIYPFSQNYAMVFFIFGLLLIVSRAVLKPSDDKFIRWER